MCALTWERQARATDEGTTKNDGGRHTNSYFAHEPIFGKEQGESKSILGSHAKYKACLLTPPFPSFSQPETHDQSKHRPNIDNIIAPHRNDRNDHDDRNDRSAGAIMQNNIPVPFLIYAIQLNLIEWREKKYGDKTLRTRRGSGLTIRLPD